MEQVAQAERKSSRRIRISVTEEDIRLGIRVSCSFCPIALAARRRLNIPVAVTCSKLKTLNRIGGRTIERFALPSKAQNFIAMFDLGNEMLSMSFCLEPQKL